MSSETMPRDKAVLDLVPGLRSFPRNPYEFRPISCNYVVFNGLP
jgi:hypothetical protein